MFGCLHGWCKMHFSRQVKKFYISLSKRKPAQIKPHSSKVSGNAPYFRPLDFGEINDSLIDTKIYHVWQPIFFKNFS